MKCCICFGELDSHYTPEGEVYWTSGHNPDPVVLDVNGGPIDTEADGYRCCDNCNGHVVMPMRYELFLAKSKIVKIPVAKKRRSESDSVSVDDLENKMKIAKDTRKEFHFHKDTGLWSWTDAVDHALSEQTIWSEGKSFGEHITFWASLCDAVEPYVTDDE